AHQRQQDQPDPTRTARRSAINLLLILYAGTRERPSWADNALAQRVTISPDRRIACCTLASAVRGALGGSRCDCSHQRGDSHEGNLNSAGSSGRSEVPYGYGAGPGSTWSAVRAAGCVVPACPPHGLPRDLSAAGDAGVSVGHLPGVELRAVSDLCRAEYRGTAA